DAYIRPLDTDGNQIEAGTYVEIEIELADVAGGGIRIELIVGNGVANLNLNTPGVHVLRRRLGNALTIVPGTVVGDAATIRRLSLRELPGNHASQSSASLRPAYQVAPERIDFDGVDDKLTVTFASSL